MMSHFEHCTVHSVDPHHSHVRTYIRTYVRMYVCTVYLYHIPGQPLERCYSCLHMWHTPSRRVPCWWRHPQALFAWYMRGALDWGPVCAQCCQTQLTLHRVAEGNVPEWAWGRAVREGGGSGRQVKRIGWREVWLCYYVHRLLEGLGCHEQGRSVHSVCVRTSHWKNEQKYKHYKKHWVVWSRHDHIHLPTYVLDCCYYYTHTQTHCPLPL